MLVTLFFEMAVDFSELIRANYLDKEYFYGSIDALWNLNTEGARQSVSYLLTIERKRDRTKDSRLLTLKILFKKLGL